MPAYQFFQNLFFDVNDFIRYGILGQNLETPKLPQKIQINIVHNKKENYYFITSEEYPGLNAAGEDPVEAWQSLNDAILTYFEVPRYIARRRGNTYHLPLPDGNIIAERMEGEYAGTQ